MKMLPRRPLSIIGALLLLAPVQARADFYSNWSFSWNFSPDPPNAAGFVPADAGVATGGTATGGAQFAASSGASGASTIPVAIVSTTSAATTTPDSFQGTPFTFGVRITDNATNASGTLTFDGALKGSLTSTSSTAVGTFSPDPGGPASLVLSGRTYKVSVNPELALPAPGGAPALLGASVSVGPAAVPSIVIPPLVPPIVPPTTIPPVLSVPEPSAFGLASVAIAALGLAGWRHRQRGLTRNARRPSLFIVEGLRA
jgi:hypothetical protein